MFSGYEVDLVLCFLLVDLFSGFLVECGLFSTPSIVVKNQFLPLWNHRRDKGKEEEIKKNEE